MQHRLLSRTSGIALSGARGHARPGSRAAAGLAVAITALLVASSAGVASQPAAAAPSRCTEPGFIHQTEVPWALERLAPQRGWPLSHGDGVLVAVIGTGIDASNAQFAPKQVRPGASMIGGGPASTDCDGTGTFVAGLIAARPDPATTVVGLAPGADLLPVRVMQSRENQPALAEPDDAARGIEYAIKQDADVIVVYAAVARDSTALKRAVKNAQKAGAVVIAGGWSVPNSTTDRPATLAPCSYPGVIGVAAVDPNGTAAEGSCSEKDVDIAAPGVDLISTSSGADGKLGHISAIGGGLPGLAAGYVAGAAALVLGYEPGLSPAQVQDRLLRSATRGPTGGRDGQLGWGIVDPYAALTVTTRDPSAPPAPGQSITPLDLPPPPPSRRPLLVALAIGVGALGVGAGAATLALAHRRRWRPGRRQAPA
ncbi:MAG: S8 family serine peptidase [Angustibacter sp.]